MARKRRSNRKAWSQAWQVPADSAVGEQLQLIDALLSGNITAPEFEHAWLAARGQELARGERPAGRLADALSRIFIAVDAYVSDPELRDQPEDMDEEELFQFVLSAYAKIYSDAPPPSKH